MNQSTPSTEQPDNLRGLVHSLVHGLALLGGATISIGGKALGMIGSMSLLLAEATGVVLRGVFVPRQRLGRASLMAQMVRVGVRAIPIIVLIQSVIGMILPLQMFPELDKFGQAEQIATINAVAAFRELGPLMTAIILSGFAGASIAAELGTMVTSEEIEALRSMALNPVRFLVVPRLLATIIMTVIKLGIDSDIFFLLTRDAISMTGFLTGLTKAAVFGLLVGLIACFLGLSVKPWQGSDGVGHATTNTVVYSIVAIVVADAVFTVIFYSYGMFT